MEYDIEDAEKNSSNKPNENLLLAEEKARYPQINQIIGDILAIEDSNPETVTAELQTAVSNLLTESASVKKLLDAEQVHNFFEILSRQDNDLTIIQNVLKILEIYSINLPKTEDLSFPEDAISLLITHLNLPSTLMILATMIKRDHSVIVKLNEITKGDITERVNYLLMIDTSCDAALYFMAAVWSTNYNVEFNKNIQKPFYTILNNNLFFYYPKNAFKALRYFIKKSDDAAKENNAILFIESNRTECFTNLCANKNGAKSAIRFFAALVYVLSDIDNLLDDFDMGLIFSWIFRNSNDTSLSKSIKYIDNIICNYMDSGSPERNSYIVYWFIEKKIYELVIASYYNCQSTTKFYIVDILAQLMVHSTPAQCNYMINKARIISIITEFLCNYNSGSQKDLDYIGELISNALETVVIFVELQNSNESRVNKLKGVPDSVLLEYLKSIEAMQPRVYNPGNTQIQLQDEIREEMLEKSDLDDHQHECLYRFVEDLDKIFGTE